jgi:hypothetical protein
MGTRLFARVYGIVFFAVGVVGFIPGLTPPHTHPGLTVEAGSGLELGLFPVNILHNLVHVAFGVWGVFAASRYDAARLYAQVVAVAYGLLALMGLLPATNTVFGLVPIYGHDVWLHALLAVVAAYFGFVHRDSSVTTTATR